MYEIDDKLYATPTPAGAYYAVSDSQDDAARRLLNALISQDQSQRLTQEFITEFLGQAPDEALHEQLYRLESLGWLRAEPEPRQAPTGPLENLLPPLLDDLTRNGKALLADPQGFYIASQGFAHETAEELSALSADVANLYQRHKGLLRNNLSLAQQAWALVDAGGTSRLGFWPLHIGDQSFALVASGEPRFNHESFLQLIWALSLRYAQMKNSYQNQTQQIGALS